jgi:hypothetical protein
VTTQRGLLACRRVPDSSRQLEGVVCDDATLCEFESGESGGVGLRLCKQARVQGDGMMSLCAAAASALSAMNGQCPGIRKTVQNSKTAGIKSSILSVVPLELCEVRSVGASGT